LWSLLLLPLSMTSGILSMGTGALIGTRSIPFNTKTWSNPKNLQIGTERLLS
jgi:hypothetical protein